MANRALLLEHLRADGAGRFDLRFLDLIFLGAGEAE